MAITGTWFEHKNIHKVTWRSPDRRTFNQIDHILIDIRHGSIMKYAWGVIGSDHYLVNAKIRII